MGLVHTWKTADTERKQDSTRQTSSLGFIRTIDSVMFNLWRGGLFLVARFVQVYDLEIIQELNCLTLVNRRVVGNILVVDKSFYFLG